MTAEVSQHNLMPIGRFSASCRLSIKALRHYADVGLLSPAYVDPHTGYRYYSREQARDAVMIAMLRSLDISIPVVRELLRADETKLDALLENETSKLEAELTRKRAALQTIERIRREGNLMPYNVAIRHEHAYSVAIKSIKTRAETLLSDSTDLVYTLFDELAEAGREVHDPVMCINETPDAEGAIVVRATVGVTEPFPKLKTATVDRIGATSVAWCEHVGPYEELGLAYHAVFAWMQQYGQQQIGAMREIYLNDPADTPPESLRTEVMVPIEAPEPDML